jgi:hypothetical protein
MFHENVFMKYKEKIGVFSVVGLFAVQLSSQQWTSRLMSYEKLQITAKHFSDGVPIALLFEIIKTRPIHLCKTIII